MGRIKSLLVKRTAEKLLGEEDEKFSDSFKNNKRILGDTMPGKRTRNVIAGYITRLKKMEKSHTKQKSL